MSNIDLASKEWCDLVFEGRNQGYGAYAMRSKAPKRRLVSVIYVLLGIVALAVIIGVCSGLFVKYLFNHIFPSPEGGDDINE